MYGRSRRGLQVIISALLHVALFTGASSLGSRSLFRPALPHLPRPRGLNRRQLAGTNESDYPASWMTLPLDHFNASDTRTFQARYWYNSTFYEPGGPVFWHDIGEGNGLLYVPNLLGELSGPSAVMTMARRFKGLALVVEHRYYGGVDEGSFPFPINKTTGYLLDLGGYVYLTTEQALEDAVYFANHLDLPLPGLDGSGKGSSSPLSPASTPWVWIGGSYPGVRGVMLRVRNPETFYAVWASSAPTQGAVEVWQYFAQVEHGMPRNCSADFQAITRHVDGVLAGGTTSEEARALTRELLEAAAASPTDAAPEVADEDVDGCDAACVGSNLQTPFDYYQYYGPRYHLTRFCDILETQNRTDVPTTDNGGVARAIAPASGLALEYDIATAWRAFLVALRETAYDSTTDEGDAVAEASYWWQTCTELGSYTTGNPDNPHSIESRFITFDSSHSHCFETFPGLAPAQPDVSSWNRYGGWDAQPSNVMWTTGQLDPWRSLSPSSTEAGAPGRRTKPIVPACNEPPKGTDLFGLIYEGMVHVTDLSADVWNVSAPDGEFAPERQNELTDPESFFAGTALFESALEQWLPCYGATR